MPYTFGAGTGDDITWATTVSLGASARACLVTGWWFPTTLTATRGLWSAGNVFGAEIDTTTSELRLRTDNTTDGQWTTTGVGLATNEWKFLAFASSTLNTGPAAAWRVWAGSISSPPVEVTVTGATAPVGNFTGSTSFYLGNKGTGTLAFQGDIADVMYYATSSGAGVVTHPFSLNVNGAISNAEALFIYERFVLPAWLGQPFMHSGLMRRSTTIGSQTDEQGYASLDNLFQVIRTHTVNATVFSGVTPTINGATWSQNGSPRPCMGGSPMFPLPAGR